jgi:hypothetical protein
MVQRPPSVSIPARFALGDEFGRDWSVKSLQVTASVSRGAS